MATGSNTQRPETEPAAEVSAEPMAKTPNTPATSPREEFQEGTRVEVLRTIAYPSMADAIVAGTQARVVANVKNGVKIAFTNDKGTEEEIVVKSVDLLAL